MTVHERSVNKMSAEPRDGMASYLVHFLVQNCKWWLLPIVIVVGIIGLLTLVGGTRAGPFVYTFF